MNPQFLKEMKKGLCLREQWKLLANGIIPEGWVIEKRERERLLIVRLPGEKLYLWDFEYNYGVQSRNIAIVRPWNTMVDLRFEKTRTGIRFRGSKGKIRHVCYDPSHVFQDQRFFGPGRNNSRIIQVTPEIEAYYFLALKQFQ